ncbi:MMPL family transporter [Desulfococcaceae bacterium HSG7]|nr:MMPL family transporter [Desulfococcaceae bacterium HSG7]
MRWYDTFVLDRPVIVIVCLMIVIAVLGYQAKDFNIDASADTLLLENDKDLRYAREISRRYGIHDFLLISYTPRKGDLLDADNLKTIARLRADLKKINQVASVMTLLDVPLLESPPVSYKDISGNIPNLESPSIDKKLARIELRDSAFYRDLLVSRDMKTTALIVNLKIDSVYDKLLAQRNEYMDKKTEGALTPTEAAQLKAVKNKMRAQKLRMNAIQHNNIKAIRALMAQNRSQADMFLGGVSMIRDDMITIIKNDLKLFGAGVFILLVVMLGIIFRRIRWIVLPMLCCFLSVIAMIGVLSYFKWDVTVISSNFISLQLIITLAIVVHLIVRFREYENALPQADMRTLVKKTVHSKFIPCLYAVLTTIAGFSSLVFCDIKPVIHFGWMMSAGILLSLALTFILFPASVMLLKKDAKPSHIKLLNFSFTDFLARFTQSHGFAIIIATIIFSALIIAGVTRLRVENSFIDYFKESTEIYQGMKVIDLKLGGTTPLDVIVQFENSDSDEEIEEEPLYEEDEEDAEFYAELDAEDEAEDENKYWFTDDRMKTVESVHDYLEGLSETGKVLSLGTLLKIARKLNHGETLDSFELAVLYTKVPDDYKNQILTPFVSFDKNEARFTVRIKDSMKSLKRDPLLKQIQHDLVHKLNLQKDRVRLAGAMILYNNMLQSLFDSQIKTLGVVALALLAMFLVLFRSLKLSLIALFPNLFSAGAVLGVMGWMDIPLDMMTVTIAAISIGIAVDNTIHYIHRFQEEFPTDSSYYQTLQRCHASIGHAMYYTSITIIIGFSILALSDFRPTLYFGLFTGLAMFIAMIASLTLLPQLLVLVKPFGAEHASD